MHCFDTLQLGRTHIIAVHALETRDGLALFDVGPESTFQNVVAAMALDDVSPKDVRHVFLSHIHFDHAGAAWRWAEGGATIHVHPRGAPHLIRPERLIESATRIYGADMERLWGKLAPVPEARVHVMNDGDVVQAGEFAVRAIDTPGHASHHNVYAWDDCVFGGDVAGVSIKGGPPIPPFVPPELDLDAWRASLGKLRALNAKTMYLPHFGRVDGPLGAHFDEVERRLGTWSDALLGMMRAGLDEAAMIPAFGKFEEDDLRASGGSEETVKDYETADPSYMAVSAARRYFQKHRPDLLAAQG